MRKIILIALVAFNQVLANGQVAKNVIVEHFTNTYCSICASKNPGFYINRTQFPQAIHIAYHPSSPYAACPLNQLNKQENDDRTNYYGIYGATPRLVIQGKVLASNANFNDASIFQSELGLNTAFDMDIKMSMVSSNNSTVTVKVKKVSASTLSSLQLYAVLVEDTLFFNAANGESRHYDVFRKSIWGASMNIASPANIGDSVIFTKAITVNSAWVGNRIYAVVMLQDQNKEMVQVARSSNLKGATTVSSAKAFVTPAIFPNPTKGVFTIGLAEPATILIYNFQGQILKQTKQDDEIADYDFSTFAAGSYYIEIREPGQKHYMNLIKE